MEGIRNFLAICLTIFISNAAAQGAIGCFIGGECKNGALVGESTASSATDCLKLCRDTANCDYFTHYESTSTCLAYISCPDAGPCSSNDCTSGDATCSSSVCDLQGRCVGTDVDFLPLMANTGQCLAACQANPACQWFSFDQSTGLCYLTGDCDMIDDTCSTCSSGERDCKTGQRHLLVGNGINFEDRVEILDLASDATSSPCILRSPLNEVGLIGTVGTFFDDRPLICGGGRSTTCHAYSPQTKRWEASYDMGEYRSYPASVMMADNQWWISGGNDLSDDKTATSILITPESGVTNYVHIPKESNEHCMVKINSTHYFVGGGLIQNSYIFNSETEKFSGFASFTRGLRLGLACGYAQNDNQIIVSNGFENVTHGDTHVLNLDDLTWQDGPDYPEEVAFSSSVPFENSFIVVGGEYQQIGTGSRAIYKYNSAPDPQDASWEKLDQQTGISYAYGTAFFVPDFYFDECS